MCVCVGWGGLSTLLWEMVKSNSTAHRLPDHERTWIQVAGWGGGTFIICSVCW